MVPACTESKRSTSVRNQVQTYCNYCEEEISFLIPHHLVLGHGLKPREDPHPRHQVPLVARALLVLGRARRIVHQAALHHEPLPPLPLVELGVVDLAHVELELLVGPRVVFEELELGKHLLGVVGVLHVEVVAKRHEAAEGSPWKLRDALLHLAGSSRSRN